MKMIKKICAFIVVFTSVHTMLSAQTKGGGFDWDRVVFGGSILPSFSNYGTTITANPFVGYKVTNNFVPGVMFSYNYSRLKDWPELGRITTFNSLGVAPFLRYSFLENFFVQAEYEFLNGSFKVTKPDQSANFGENNLFLGGGYLNRISNNGALFAQIMYNVTWKGAAGNSVYASPLIYRVGFTIF